MPRMTIRNDAAAYWFSKWRNEPIQLLDFEKAWNNKVELYNQQFDKADELGRAALDDLLNEVDELGKNKKYDDAKDALDLWPSLLPAMNSFYERRRAFVTRDQSKLPKENEQVYDELLANVLPSATKQSYDQGFKEIGLLVEKHRQECQRKESYDRARLILTGLEERVAKLPEDLATPLTEKLKKEKQVIEKVESKISDINAAGKRLQQVDAEVKTAEIEQDARPERTKSAQEILSKLPQYEPQETWTGPEAGLLREQHKQVKKLLEKLPPSNNDLYSAGRAYDKIPDQFNSAQRVAKLMECRQRSQTLIKTIQERLAKGRPAVMEPIGEQLSSVEKVVKNVKAKLGELQSAESTLQKLDTLSHAEILAKDPIDKLVEKVKGCETPEGLSSEQSKTFGELRSKTLKTLETASAEDGKKAVEELEKERERLEEETRKLVEQLEKDFGGKEELKKLYASFSVAELKKLSDDVGGAPVLKGMLTAVTPEKFTETAEQLGGAKALAEIVTTGFGGDATKLGDMVKEFGGDLTPVATLLEKGGLKASPKVVSNLIKDGCNGEVAKLKQFTEVFQKDEDLSKLASMVKSGGLDGSGTKDNKDASDTLGKLLKDGLEGDPKNLLALAEAFNGKPEKLKTMVVAFNDEPTPPPAKAGERIGAVYKRMKEVKPPPAKTMDEMVKFHDEVADFADKGTKYSDVDLSDAGMYLSKGELLRQAITFEKKSKGTLKQPALPSGFTASMDHFSRHSREYCSFSEGDSDLFMNATAKVGGSDVTASIEDIANGVVVSNSKLRSAAKGRAKDTTLWNKEVTDQQIATYCEQAFKKVATTDKDGNVTGFAAGDGVTEVENKPTFKSYELEVDAKSKLKVRIGIDTAISKVTQFFPISADPPLSTLVWGDMMAIKKAMQF